jgi:hypothetical protein
LYIIMDTLRRRRAEQKEEEKKQKLEENFHNGINNGREILNPLYFGYSNISINLDILFEKVNTK